MDNSSTSVESLFNLAFNKLCHSMNEDILRKILKDYPSSIIFEVIWKILGIDNINKVFLQRNEGTTMFAYMISNDYHHDYFRKINMIGTSTEDQQMTLYNKFEFSNYFDLELFFKLVKNCQFRCKLIFIFQICVKEKGLEFPKQFAKLWIESNTQDNEINLCLIEHGLLLGVFLGDSGWCSESAFVLSYIYKIISTKWVCSDQNLKLIKIIQCLTKWLTVVIIYHDFDEAKVILSHILNNIKRLEQIEGSRLYLINTYVAISQYYYVLFDYNKAWLWTIKAIDELDDGCSDILRLLVMSHCVKICSVTNRLSMAKKIIEELYTYNKEIDPNVWIDVTMNIAYYSLNANLAKYNLPNYFIALDLCIHLFGYINLYTANIFIAYANARFGANYSEIDFTHALSIVNQGICIMHTIGVPNNNMFLINAQVIKSFILQKLFIMEIPPPQSIESIIPTQERLKINLEDLVSWHWKAIEVSSKSFGVNALITARSYYNLGRFYQNQVQLMDFKLMQLTLFAIGGSMEYLENPEVQLCHSYLSNMHKTQREKVDKAEQFYLQTKSIYETTYGSEHFWLLHVYQKLSEVYDIKKDSPKYITCLEKIWIFKAQMKEIVHHQMPIINGTKSCISLEQLKCIVNDRE